MISYQNDNQEWNILNVVFFQFVIFLMNSRFCQSKQFLVIYGDKNVIKWGICKTSK